jgi:hypothetical protein
MFDFAPDAWMADSLCLEYPAAWFFPEKGEPAKRAKDVCAKCLVMRECLTLAISENIQVGIFGGTGPADRRKMRTAGVSLEAALEAAESRLQRERRLDAEHRDDELDEYAL